MAETARTAIAPDIPNYEVRVGLFTVIALIILLWGWSWLKSFSLIPPQRFIVEFHDVAGLNTNAPVNISGVHVGVVEKIILHGRGQVYCYLKIPSENTVVPEGSKVTIQTLGLVGAKYVEISLPEVRPNEPPPPPIAPDTIITGEDPVRIELYANKIAANLNNITSSMAGKSAREGFARALETSGNTMASIRDAANKLNKASDMINNTAGQFNKSADNASSFFSQGTQTMQKVSGLAQDWQKTSTRVNKILDNPAFSSDLKETATLAKETANKIQTAVHELNTTLADKSMRSDLTTMLNKLNASTDNIYHSMQIVKTIGDDQSLRADLKEVISNAKDAMNKANALLGQESFGSDARQTMTKLRTAADSVDQASRNINLVLEHKHPLLHLMFGKGVKIQTTTKTTTVKEQGSSEPQPLKTINGSLDKPLPIPPQRINVPEDQNQ